MIRNLVFDMGNVLIHWTADGIMDSMGVKNPEDRKILLSKMFRTPEWTDLDWGRKSVEEGEKIFRSRIPERLWLYIHHAIYWEDMLSPVEGMADYIREKKKEGYSIYLLSNAPARCEEIFPSIPGSECFDGIVYSGSVKMIKPHRDIFLYLLDKFSLRTGECLFIDDLEANVKTALECGMHGLVFKGKPEEIEQLLLSLQA